MNGFRARLGEMTISVFTAAGVTWFLMFVGLTVIDGLPRPSQGESLSVPWSVCLLGFVLMPVFLPWLVSRSVCRSSALRIVFVLLLVAFALSWYFICFDDILSKAWRRGL